MLSRQHVVRWWAIACVLLLSACDRPPSPPRDRPITYRLAWTWGRAERRDGGWETLTDRGYRVQVTRGYVVSFSVELVECPRATAGAWFTPRAAYAWHPASATNPATVRSAPVESLTAPIDQEAGTVTPPGIDYCQAHYLIARARQDSPGLPRDVDMVDASLRLEGSVSRDGTTQPLAIVTAAANGSLKPFTVAGGDRPRVDTRVEAATVTFTRRLDTLFDGIEFATTTPEVVANQILDHLAQDVVVQVAVSDR